MIVENITTKEVKTKFGMKPTYSVKADGEWFSHGFKKPAFKAGDTVEFTFSEGLYGKVIDEGSSRVITSAAPPTAVPTPAAAAKYNPGFTPKPFPIPALHGDRAIIRQNALTNAREMVIRLITAGSDAKPEERDWAGRQKQFEVVSAEIVRIARIFEAYSAGDSDLEAALKSMKEE